MMNLAIYSAPPCPAPPRRAMPSRALPAMPHHTKPNHALPYPARFLRSLRARNLSMLARSSSLASSASA